MRIIGERRAEERRAEERRGEERREGERRGGELIISPVSFGLIGLPM
jgi:hypothetical protein